MNKSYVVSLLALGLAGCMGIIDGDQADQDLGSDSEALRFSSLPGYVALGDSIDFGVGASVPDNAYVNQFHAFLEEEHFKREVDHQNLSVVGATSADILRDQTLDAIVFNAEHLFQKKVMTLGSGGNDLLAFIKSPEFAPCATGDQAGCQANLGVVIKAYAANLDETMKRLRFLASQKNAVILARTQYNGFVQPSCSVNGAIDKNGQVFLPAAQVRALINLGFLALEGAVQDPSVTNDPFPGLNDVMRTTAKKYGAITVDIARPFLLAAQSGQELLIRDCIHPNDAGHDLITDIAIDAFTK